MSYKKGDLDIGRGIDTQIYMSINNLRDYWASAYDEKIILEIGTKTEAEQLIADLQEAIKKL